LPDLQRTEKLRWWVGRPLRVRIHLGIYLLQQLFDLTDRQAEYFLHDNAAFRLFCGYGRLRRKFFIRLYKSKVTMTLGELACKRIKLLKNR